MASELTQIIEDDPKATDKFKRIGRTQAKFVQINQEQSNDIRDEKKSFDAYFADSWDDEVKKTRESKGLPVSDVARFASIVDTISGNQRQNRTSVHAFALEKDDQITTDVANLYLKYRDRKGFHWHENSLIYSNGIVARRAHLEFALRRNPNDGTLETVRIERPAKEVFISKPFRRFDHSDAARLIHVQWLPLNTVKELFRNKVSDIRQLDFRPPDSDKRTVEISHADDEYNFPDREHPHLFFKDENNQVRLIRMWEKRLEIIYRVINPAPVSFNDILVKTFDSDGLTAIPSKGRALRTAIQFLNDRPEVAVNIVSSVSVRTPDGELVEEVTEKNIQSVAEEMVQDHEKDVYSLHVISGRVELDWHETWGDFLPWCTFWCYFLDGKAGGLHERVKDIVQEENFMHAKLMERLGRLGKMPLFLEQDATVSDDEDEIRENFEDGGIIWTKSGSNRRGGVLVQEDKTLNTIPSYIALEESLNNRIKELTGANDPIQGRSPGANTAGIAIELLQRRGAALIAPIEDNFKRFLMMCANLELKMLLRARELQPNLTALKMVQIVGGMVENVGQVGNEPVMEALQGATSDQEKSLLMDEILEKMQRMEYDFTIDEFIQSPTMKLTWLQVLVQLFNMIGAGFDPRVIVENSELPQKFKDMLLSFQGTPEAQQQIANRQNGGGGFNSEGTPSGIEGILNNLGG